MDPHDEINAIELQDCPLCGGPGLLEEEGGWCLYIQCLDCGCHTAELSFDTPEECPLCKQGMAVDAVVDKYGYSKL